MIPSDASKPVDNMYFVLLPGDIIQPGDEYYNPWIDKWIPVDHVYFNNSFIEDLESDSVLNQEYDPVESKPIRRKNPNYMGSHHNTTSNWAGDIKVTDPDTHAEIDLCLYKHESGGMFAVDFSYLDQVFGDDDWIINSPFDSGKTLLFDPNISSNGTI